MVAIETDLAALNRRLNALYDKMEDARLAQAEATAKAIRARRASTKADAAETKAAHAVSALYAEIRDIHAERDRLMADEDQHGDD